MLNCKAGSIQLEFITHAVQRCGVIGSERVLSADIMAAVAVVGGGSGGVGVGVPGGGVGGGGGGGEE